MQPQAIGISAFDLDHTLLTVNSSFEFGKYLYKNKLLSTRQMLFASACYILHKSGCLSLDSLHKKIFNVAFKGRSKTDLNTHVHQFLDCYLDAYWNRPVFEKLLDSKQAGHITTIYSSAPDFLVSAIASRLQIHHHEGTIYHTDESGNLSMIDKVVEGNAKAELLTRLAGQHRISKNNVFTYSDSYLDLPFLEVSGNPVAVNPDARLKRICKQKNWQILSEG